MKYLILLSLLVGCAKSGNSTPAKEILKIYGDSNIYFSGLALKFSFYDNSTFTITEIYQNKKRTQSGTYSVSNNKYTLAVNERTCAADKSFVSCVETKFSLDEPNKKIQILPADTNCGISGQISYETENQTTDDLNSTLLEDMVCTDYFGLF